MAEIQAAPELEAAAAPLDDPYDCIIIGGGPAGLTAGLYLSRARMKVALIERGICGGQIATTEVVENYLGFPDTPSGPELAAEMERHAVAFGLELHTFTSVYTVDKAPDGHWFVRCDEGDFHTKSVIVATGAAPKKLGVPGENEFAGRGVSYCATCDGSFFKDKKLVVVGGGDSAVEEAMFLTRFATEVTIVHRRDELRAEKIIQERAFAQPKLSFAWSAIVKEIRGDAKVGSVLLESTKDGRQWEHPCEGVFIYVGYNPNTAMVADHVEFDELGYVKTDETMATSAPGIFVAGDVRANQFKQIIVAAGEGAVAARSAQRWAETL